MDSNYFYFVWRFSDGGVALIISKINHRFAQEREEYSAAERRLMYEKDFEEKMVKERYYIATELVFMLERYGEGCIPVAEDSGHNVNDKGYSIANSCLPVIALDHIKGDWRSLPPRLLYRIREFEFISSESHRHIDISFAYDDPPDFSHSFFTRQRYAAKLGIRAFILSTRLRKLCNMPISSFTSRNSTSPHLLWKLYKKHRVLLLAKEAK